MERHTAERQIKILNNRIAYYEDLLERYGDVSVYKFRVKKAQKEILKLEEVK